MGIYLNSASAFGAYRSDSKLTYFVDKTDILSELVPIVDPKGNQAVKSGTCKGGRQKYIAITRPCRFGKTVMANMVAAYFGKGTDSGKVFGDLKVSGFDWYEKHLNRHNVIISGSMRCR